MFDTNVLIAGMILGAFGMWYLVYGKNQGKIIALICGVVLTVFPFFVTDLYVIWGVGIFCIILPFLIRV